MRSGVSPLIAAVLLVALGIGVAALFASWAIDFADDRATQIDNRTGDDIRCSNGGITVYNATFDGGVNETAVTVSNTGTVTFSNVSVATFTDATIQTQTTIANLIGGEDRRVTVEGTVDQPDTVRVVSMDCPEISSETSDIGDA